MIRVPQFEMPIGDFVAWFFRDVMGQATQSTLGAMCRGLFAVPCRLRARVVCHPMPSGRPDRETASRRSYQAPGRSLDRVGQSDDERDEITIATVELLLLIDVEPRMK